MRKPKMILFDYGDTLIYEAPFDGVRGNEAVLRHATKNEKGYSAGQVSAFAESVFGQLSTRARDHDVEVHNHNMQRLYYEYLGIETALSQEEMEWLFFENAAPGTALPGSTEVLAYLRDRGIRSGVISNIGFSGGALKRRLNQLLPENDFDFVIASSEYVFRKPHPFLFQLALNKAGLQAEDVWFCGDTVRADILGASGVGIFPVWCRMRSQDTPPDCRHLAIDEWCQLIQTLEACTIVEEPQNQHI